MMAKTIYTIKDGDSLSKIARDELNEMDRWRELAFINSIEAPFTIYPGQQILLPDDEPLEIVVTSGTDQAAPVREAGMSISPATAMLLAAGAAIWYFWDDLTK